MISIRFNDIILISESNKLLHLQYSIAKKEVL